MKKCLFQRQQLSGCAVGKFFSFLSFIFHHSLSLYFTYYHL